MTEHVPAAAAPDPRAETVKVWDPFVRLFHWSLAAGFFVAYLSEDLLLLHVWAGYMVGGLVLLRILWGFVGPRHARFGDFLYPPGAILRYLVDLARLRAPRHLGHGPAGAAMVFLLLGGVLAITATGLALDAAETRVGPLAAATEPGAPGLRASPLAPARASEYEGGEHAYGERAYAEHEAEAEEEAFEELHEASAQVVLALVILHIAGVLWASFATGENLTRAMVTGRKRPL